MDRDRKRQDKLSRRTRSALSTGHRPGGGRQKGVGQADIHHGPKTPAPHCGDPEQLLQRQITAPSEQGVLPQVISACSHEAVQLHLVNTPCISCAIKQFLFSVLLHTVP